MICQKCKKDFSGIKPEKNKTYKGIDYHHSPPKFMLKEWEGEEIPLCRKHHRQLHDEILKIMFKHSNLLKFKKSEYWTWIGILPINRKKCIEEVIYFTSRWLGNDS